MNLDEVARISGGESEISAECQRIQAYYRRRAVEISPDLYAPWRPSSILLIQERARLAAQMLYRSGAFPRAGDRCLEVGCGSLGWLGDLINWGVRERDLHGCDVNSASLEKARERLPAADLRFQDAAKLPWPDGTFKLVIASTVFSSILSQHVRFRVAAEIERVLAVGGALIWYDFHFNNPANKNVRKVSRREIGRLFPNLHGEIRRVTLAPPLARLIAPLSWNVASLLSCVPFLRTHLLGVLLKR